jgi:hypothetical protein
MNLIFQSSPWWMLACLLAGGVYAVALYEPIPGRTVPGGWERPLNYGLAALRFLAVALLGLLLLNPLIRSVQTITEKPTVVLAIDNSESMTATDRPALTRTLAGLKTLQQQLADKGISVAVRTLDPASGANRGGNAGPENDLNQLTFTQRSTDLSGLLSGIRSDYEGRNLTDVLLVSDGIVNQGLSPTTAGQYPFAVHTVVLGDTVPRRDVALRAVVANRIAYLGNLFPLRAEVVSNGFGGQSGTVVLRQNGKELARQSVRFGRNDTFDQLTFQATATQKGVQHFTVEVLPQPGEFSPRNNRQDVYIDVIDGREKILLLGLAPHPDLKALRAILAKNQNYDIDLRTLTGAAVGSPEATLSPDKPYDLIILHQLPDLGGLGSETVRRLLARPVPVLFVLGNQSATGALNPLDPVVSVAAPINQFDKVTARFNPAFKQVNLDPAKLDLLAQLPPLSVPYGEYRLLPGSEVVLSQQVGTVLTDKPLLAFNLTGPRKAAVLLGEGLWQWRLEEFALTEKQAVVDELIQKVIQLISVKEDRRKLRVYPIRNEFVAGETIAFEAELYNDIYERLYDKPVKLDLTDEKGISRSYTFSPTEANGRFEISRLPEGVYQYRAVATPGTRPETATGQFVVRDLQLEALSTTADHAMLRQLSAQTNGRFVQPASLATLIQYLTTRQAPDRLSSTEALDELINQRWLFFLILLLAGAEWGLRKYFGGY